MTAGINLDTTRDFLPLYDKSHPYYNARYKVFYGGRGGRKSWEAVQGALLQGLEQPKRILCTRELQTSIKDSIHKTIADRIAALGLSDHYTVLRDTIRGANGTECIFKGLRHNSESIKSTEGIDICIVEEAEKVSEDSWRYLTPTIRKPGSQIWVLFNPDLESDPTYQRFVVHPPEGAYVRKVNWSDNPQLSAELNAERLHMMRTDPDAYQWIWEGNCRKHTDAQVLKGKWRIDVFETPTDADGPYFGADWGFSQDPTTLVKCWVRGHTLFIEYEAYGVGVEITDTPDMFDSVPDSRDYTIRADSARPETISHVKGSGFRIEAAKKWSGSVEDGIAYLRSFDEIVIHSRCKHTIEEATLYSYKVDRLTGDVLPAIVDKHNHIWDAVRYALGPLIQKKPSRRFAVI